MNNPFETLDQRLSRIEASLEKMTEPKPEPIPGERYVTTAQACEILHMSRPTLWKLEKQGVITSVYMGSVKRWRLSDIEALGREGKR